ncbi:uncharacterized protein LOC126298541 [Schistocerca gregaria]|uniref:uncharacterized protein LOC126298541 n=1 Tax=Schistocerca gregaria TaxID=7010 RepID=UPI00211E01F0|nr:uncharacterized protein LOC126298539 isoform X1 [Schistocerca gregaria]XP_049845859.1 uncharacterized protein LOC126298541 [Schistocerca gregaria]
MAGNNDDSVDRFIREYISMLEKCSKKCIHSTNVSELTRMEINCVKKCVADQLKESEKSTTKKSWGPKKDSTCCIL